MNNSDTAKSDECREIACMKCGEKYESFDIVHGMCPDCYADFDSRDLEEKLEELGIY